MRLRAVDHVELKTLAIEIASILPPCQPEPSESPAPSGAALPAVIQSARARAIRRISEIVLSRQWHSEIVRTLDRHQVSYVDDLPDEAVYELRDRMEYYEDCVQCACDPDDAPPAR
jgi:hypothetical protein